MKTVKIPDRLWETFLQFLQLGVHNAKLHQATFRVEYTKDEEEVIERIERLLKKEGWK